MLSSRKRELARDYIARLDEHIADLKEGRADRAMEIRDLAALLFVHPAHLNQTIREVTGKTTCDLYEERLVRASKDLLLTTPWSIARIARQLTYDPSNFTKFFKHFTGLTPKQFRDQHQV